MTEPDDGRTAFRTLEESKPADWVTIQADDRRFDEALPQRLTGLLKALGETGGALPVSRLEHCLQAATRAHKAGEAEDYVVAALLHDAGELYFPHNHADFAADLMRPFVDDMLYFILKRHTIFQGYHYWHVLGGDRHARDAWRGHPAFAATARFCALYDQPSFDAAYPSMPLEAFEPMIARVFALPRTDYDSNRPPFWRRIMRRAIRVAGIGAGA